MFLTFPRRPPSSQSQPKKTPQNPPRAQLIACDGLPLFAFVALVGGGGGNQGNEEGLLLSWVMYPDSSRRPSERRQTGSQKAQKGPPSARSQKSESFIVFAKEFPNTFFHRFFFKILTTNGVPKFLRQTGSQKAPKGPPSARSQKSESFIVFAKEFPNKIFHRFFSKILTTNGVPKRSQKGPPPPRAKKVHNSSFLQKESLINFCTDFFPEFGLGLVIRLSSGR